MAELHTCLSNGKVLWCSKKKAMFELVFCVTSVLPVPYFSCSSHPDVWSDFNIYVTNTQSVGNCESNLVMKWTFTIISLYNLWVKKISSQIVKLVSAMPGCFHWCIWYLTQELKKDIQQDRVWKWRLKKKVGIFCMTNDTGNNGI